MSDLSLHPPCDYLRASFESTQLEARRQSNSGVPSIQAASPSRVENEEKDRGKLGRAHGGCMTHRTVKNAQRFLEVTTNTRNSSRCPVLQLLSSPEGTKTPTPLSSPTQ